jgi:phospholipid/cholesterol/gamma-HCH transport system substrate-binding protein
VPSARLIGVGAFVTGGLLLFAVALFMIGERQMIFTKQFQIYTEFSRLSGLREGSPIQVSGMAAGEVKEILLPKSPAQKFRVRLQVREDLHPLVRIDSVASIRTEGLVGGQFLMITAGSDRAPEAPQGSTIPSHEPFDIADLLEQASRTVSIVNDTIVQVRGDVEKAIQNISATVHDADQLITSVGGDVKTIAAAGARISDDVQAVTRDVRQGRGTIGQLVTNDELYRRATTIASEAEQTVTNLREASDKAKKVVDDIARKGGAAQGLTTEFRDTLAKARDTLTHLAEDTEALKHNWFFSGYFKRRGYYSLAEISPEEYRRGVIEQSDRVKLRIWLDASLLFATQPEGALALTDAGKARLDSAMGDFLKYVGSGPVVVEGYAQQGASAERFLASRARASVVRDHLVGRFALNPDSVGVMPLGSDSTGSPGGGHWDGVAIAVFVPPEALRKPGK